MGLLREYMGDLDTSLLALVDVLQDHFGQMERVGGTRVYDIDSEGKHGAIFLLHDLSAIGFGWKNREIVETIYYWNPPLNMDRSPDYALDLPAGGNLDGMLPAIVQALTAQQQGRIDL